MARPCFPYGGHPHSEAAHGLSDVEIEDCSKAEIRRYSLSLYERLSLSSRILVQSACETTFRFLNSQGLIVEAFIYYNIVIPFHDS